MFRLSVLLLLTTCNLYYSMKVLFLTEWYPHRYDAMVGLFVRKHAEAVARQGVDVCVLYLLKDKHIQRNEVVEQTTNGVREIYVYYPKFYLRALRQGYAIVRKKWGMPDVCQLNVITKNALLPLWLRFRYKIPYIVVEHWTGYLSISFSYKGFWHKRLAELTTRRSSMILPVSKDLGKAMQQCGLQNKKWQVINNVVDDFFFASEQKTSSDKKQLLHISCFDEPHKNVCGILRAVRVVCEQRQDFCLNLVGIGPDFDEVYQYAQSLQFPDGVLRWTGELQPQDVKKEFDNADCFIFFSNYETAGVVLSESLAAGVPIISTPVGIAPEIVDEHIGLIVPIRDEKALAESICYMLDHHEDYDNEHIRSCGKQYSYDVVGKQLLSVYDEVRKDK